MKIPFANSDQLTRRLLSNYLMFGLLSIVTLAVSMLVMMRASQAPSSGPGLLARLADTAKRLTQDAADNEGAEQQKIIEAFSREGGLEFCGVLNKDGVYSAHSIASLRGRKGIIRISADAIPGVIEHVSYLREDQSGPKEYWLPLRRDDKVFGILQARLVTEERSQLTQLMNQHFATAITVPVILLLLGTLRLQGVVQPCATFEEQLAGIARNDRDGSLSLHCVEESSPAAEGWNMLVNKLEHGQVLKNLESRLNDVLGGVRTEKYEQILKNMSDGVAITDSSGVVTFANSAFARLLDSEEQSIAHQPLINLIPQAVSENIEQYNLHCQEMSRPAVMELHRSHDLADGVLRLARVPFTTDSTGVSLQLWSLRDISQLKLIEHARDQFVDTATHELRTPLSNIKICAESLEIDDELEEEIRKSYLNTISSEASRLGRFVDEFLNISRMEAGSLTLNRHPTNIERLIQEVLEKTRGQMDHKRIELQVHLPAKLPELNLDKDKISAALVNLLGNAAKYTPEGGKVSLNVEQASSELRIQVEDSGIGIAPEELDKVFNKFFRSDDQRVRDIAGTGLGLTFSQEVARLHGGGISVRSEVNQGSRFTMTLPIA